MCIKWGFEIPTELLLYLRKCFFISINKTIICEKLKKNVIYGGETLKQCTYSLRGIKVLTDSQIKCSANWIFPVFELRYIDI